MVLLDAARTSLSVTPSAHESQVVGILLCGDLILPDESIGEDIERRDEDRFGGGERGWS